jgi:hypothetical protein
MASALRRSEFVALTVSDLTRTPCGMDVRVARSKTDREGRGAVVAVPEGRRLRPVAHLLAWLESAGITAGQLRRPGSLYRLLGHRAPSRPGAASGTHPQSNRQEARDGRTAHQRTAGGRGGEVEFGHRAEHPGPDELVEAVDPAVHRLERVVRRSRRRGLGRGEEGGAGEEATRATRPHAVHQGSCLSDPA